MRSLFAGKSPLLAFVPACFGAALLLLLPAAERWLAAHYGAGLYTVNVILWLAAALWGVSRLLKAPTPEARLRLLLVLLAFVLSVFPLGDPDRTMITVQSLALIALALLAAGLLACRPLHPVLARLWQSLHRLRKMPGWLFVGSLYVLFLAAALLIGWHCYHFLPGVSDSLSQYIHAKFIASGHLYGTPHPLQQFFNTGLMIVDGDKWYSQYQPLHALLLGLGMLAGAPWLVNPLDGALTLVATYALARRVAGEGTARIAGMLTLGCPFILFMSAEYMNHATALLFGTLFMLCYVATTQAQERNDAVRWRWAAGAGLSLGGVVLTRPLDALEIGLPFMLYSLVLLARNWRSHLPLLATMAAAGLACLAFQGWYNLQTTGEAFLFPYARYHWANVPGFTGRHTLWKGLVEARNLWLRLNQMLFEWIVPCGLFAAIACLRPLRNRYLRLLLAVVVSVTLVNTLNRFHSSLFGPRYLYELSTALIILSAVGIRRLPVLLRWKTRGRIASPPLRGLVAVLLIVLYAGGWFYRMPMDIRSYDNNYVDGNARFYFSMMAQATPPALVFIGRPPHADLPPGDHGVKRFYGDDEARRTFMYVSHTDPPQGDAPVIFALDLGDVENRELIDYYPGRRAYVERGGRLYPIDRSTYRPRHLP